MFIMALSTAFSMKEACPQTNMWNIVFCYSFPLIYSEHYQTSHTRLTQIKLDLGSPPKAEYPQLRSDDKNPIQVIAQSR